jgi:hypothetical protein
MGNMGLPDPSDYITYFNDFLDYVAGDWTSTVTGTGTSTLSTALVGGNLVIANSASNGDAVYSQLKGTGFKYQSGKRLAFKARFKVDDATNAALIVGLQEVDTTPLDVNNGIAFYKAAASTQMTGAVEASNTQSSTNILTMASDTYVSVAFAYDPKRNAVLWFKDDILLGSAALTHAPSSNLTVSIGVQNGTAAARTLTVDYVLAMQER